LDYIIFIFLQLIFRLKYSPYLTSFHFCPCFSIWKTDTITCLMVYLQDSVSTFTKTVVSTNKRKMDESEPIILTCSEILEKNLTWSYYTRSLCSNLQSMQTVFTTSTLTYLWLSNELRMRNSVLGMVDATLKYAVKPAWSSVLLPLSETFAPTSRNLYIQYLKNNLSLIRHMHW